MDESGLFYKATSTKTLYVKGQKCSGGKQSKERLTIALCANWAGDKEKPLIIGKSAHPRCFKHVTPLSLPVAYYSNCKAWMTSSVFTDWLKQFDSRMGRQQRKVLLFLDNAPSGSHADITLDNVQLKFFPPNTTSKLQPMDQGIIQTVKLKYRKHQLQRILQELEKDKTATGIDVAKKMNVLDAIHWVNAAWKETQPDTITKCFYKAGFQEGDGERGGVLDPDTVAVDPDMDSLAQELYGCSFEDMPYIDEEVFTCNMERIDWSLPATTLLEQLQDWNEPENQGGEVSEDEDDDGMDPDALKNVSELLCLVQRGTKFCAKEGLSTALSMLHDLEGHLSDIWSQRRAQLRQAPIEHFFSMQQTH